MQWAPVGAPPVVHLAGKSIVDDQLMMLDAFHIESKVTYTRGQVVIAPAADAGQPAGLVVERSGIWVNGGATVSGGVTISGGSKLRDGVVVEGSRQMGLSDATVPGTAGIFLARAPSSSPRTYEFGVFSCLEEVETCSELFPPPDLQAAVVALDGTAKTPAAGVYARSYLGYGVMAQSFLSVGVFGLSYISHGVQGETSNPGYSGVHGSSVDGKGVSGYSEKGSSGVHGSSVKGDGVVGHSQEGRGGVFSSGGANAQLHLVPLSAVPASARAGDIVMLAGGVLRVYDGHAWKTVVVQ